MEKEISKTRLVVITVLWLVGALLLIAASTNLFRERPTSNYIWFYFLILMNTLFTAALWHKYSKQRKK